MILGNIIGCLRGDDGATISYIRQTKVSNEDHGENEITIALTDGRTYVGKFINGSTGPQGPIGPIGPTGKTAYEYAVERGFEGDETEYGYRMVADYATSNELKTERARIDQLLTSGEGTVSGDEMTDLRIDIDGVAHETAGSAVRSQLQLLLESINYNSYDIGQAKAQIETKIDGAYADADGYLYLTSGDDVVVGPIGPFAGGSGGSIDTNNAVLTVANTTGWISKTISDSESCEVSFNWSSVEGEFATGNGSANIKINGTSKLVKNITQGDVVIDLKEYLVIGSNAVRITVSDIYGNTKTISFNVERVSFFLTSSFDDSVVYSTDITFPYIPTGSTTKNMQFILDGTMIGTAEVTTSGRQKSFVIPEQPHGAHTFEVYFTTIVNDNTVESNHLVYDIMFEEEGCNTTIIASSFNIESVQQYYSVVIPWIAYTPNALSTDVTLSADGKVIQELTVDRTKHSWVYRLDKVGDTVLEIAAGDIKKTFNIKVMATDIDVFAEENDLGLYLSSYGRSNNESNPGVWSYGNISADFDNFNFVSNGWLSDSEGNTVCRVNGDARLTIPYKIFASDFRTTGKTIEFEIATRDVLNYDAVMLSCTSGGKGIEITTQMATFASELSSISTKYKEEEHIRISFVVEKKSGNKLLYCYINGVLTRCCLYSEDDDFSQALPVDITIGSNECTTDIYNIRVYDNDLTRHQMLDNWIADTQNGAEKKDRYDRNNIYDTYGNITIDTLKKDVPYLVLICPVLPTFKGDKKTCSGYYVDPVHPERSFTFENAQIDVQGTSSQYYYIKNIKAKFTNGITLENGTLTYAYQLNNAGVGTNVFTFKADVASSEGFLNVILAKLYNDLCPVKTPAQEDNPSVRQTIDGTPIVIFHDNGSGPAFYGKFNFNHDKGTPEVFGFEEGDESWEILQNGTDRVGFKSADFNGNAWKNDFEARYPEDNTNTFRLAEFAAWIASTNTEAATDKELNEAVTYDDVIYTNDTEDYRLAKFKNELANHASVEALVFYYLFTLIFLCIDQREKNASPTWISRLMRWLVLFYDADSSMGTDNKGNLAFDYWLEDIDFTDAGEPVFNGQNSVLWKNLRTCFWDRIESEYVRLRTTLGADEKPLLSYESVINKIKDHVGTWCEAIYNEDAYKKYIEPFILNGDASYLPMLRGNKMEHVMWWLYNRFRYLDSLFATGTSMENRIMIRAHAKANVTMKSYVNMYGRVYYNALIAQHRMTRGQSYEFVWDATGAEDAVIGINDADMITDIGDLAPLLPETIDISKAIHLGVLTFGNADIVNNNMTTVTLGNNVLLRLINGQNCPNLAGTIDASGCTGLEEAYFNGTSITYLKLPNGGSLKILHLPETVTNLTLMNLMNLEELVIPSYANISTLRLENVGSIVDTFTILESISSESRVRLVGVDWNFDDASDLLELSTTISAMRGLDENGNNIDIPLISGKCHITALTGGELVEIKEAFPYLNVTYTALTSQLIYMNEEGTEELHRETVYNGGNGNDPIANNTLSTPTKESTAQYHYTYGGWSLTPGGDVDANALSNVEMDRTVYVAFNKEIRSYTVNFYNGTTLLQSLTVEYGKDAKYTGSTPTNTSTGNTADFEFTGWKPEPTNIQGNTNCYAQYYDKREITDGWDTIAQAAVDGTYTTKYAIGAYKNVDIAYGDGTTETIPVEVVAHNHDELADGIRRWEKVGTVPSNFVGFSTVMYNNEIHALNNSQHYKYNGSEWTLIESTGGTNAVVFNNLIYVLKSGLLMSWDGTTWTEVSTLPYDGASRLIVYNNELHTMGAGNGNARFHYKWNGTEWTSVSTLPNPLYSSFAIVSYNDAIYLLGSPASYAGKQLYKYNGSAWTRLEDLPFDGLATVTVLYGDELHIFNNKQHYILKDDVISFVENIPWSVKSENQSLPMVVFNGEIHLLGCYVDKKSTHVKWSGASWTSVGKLPFRGSDVGYVVYNNEIHKISGEGTYNSHHKYDGTEWVQIGKAPYSTTGHHLVVYNGKIHTIVNGTHYTYDGTEWSTIDDTVPYNTNANHIMAVYNNEIHLLGGSMYGTSQLHYKWNGTEWTSVSTLPIGIERYTITSKVGGDAFEYNGCLHIITNTNHYKWDGTEWTVASTLMSTASGNRAAVHSNCIYVTNKDGCYKWDGTEWTMVCTKSTSYDDNWNGAMVVYRGKLHLLGMRATDNSRYGHFVLENPKASLTFVAKNAMKDDRKRDGSLYWKASGIRTWLNETLLTSLPNDLQLAIKDTKKFSDTSLTTIISTVDKMWLASLNEVGMKHPSYTANGQGECYPVFTNNTSRQRTKVGSSTPIQWHLRSAYPTSTHSHMGVKADGNFAIIWTNGEAAVVFGFCI